MIITQSGKFQLIDWEFAGSADPAHDLARLFAISELNTTQRNFFLTKYAECDAQTHKINLASLKQRIALAIPIHYFSVVLWTKFTAQFICADSYRSTLLDQTILAYRQKTLDALDDLTKQSSQNIRNWLFFKLIARPLYPRLFRSVLLRQRSLKRFLIKLTRHSFHRLHFSYSVRSS